jgi:hypothetical protein
MKWQPIKEFDILKPNDIVSCLCLYKDRIILGDTNNAEWFRNHRKYELKNDYNYFIKLPNIDKLNKKDNEK